MRTQRGLGPPGGAPAPRRDPPSRTDLSRHFDEVPTKSKKIQKNSRAEMLTRHQPQRSAQPLTWPSWPRRHHSPCLSARLAASAPLVVRLSPPPGLAKLLGHDFGIHVHVALYYGKRRCRRSRAPPVAAREAPPRSPSLMTTLEPPRGAGASFATAWRNGLSVHLRKE